MPEETPQEYELRRAREAAETPQDGNNGQVFLKDIAGTYGNPCCPFFQRWQVIPLGVGELACVVQHFFMMPNFAMVACRVPGTNCWFSPWPVGFPFRGYNKDGKTGIYVMGCEDENSKWVKVDGPGGRKPESATMER